jgi:hypothetical protein
MRLTRFEAALVCCALESAAHCAETAAEQNALSELLIRLGEAAPFAPFATAAHWRQSRLGCAVP